MCVVFLWWLFFPIFNTHNNNKATLPHGGYFIMADTSSLTSLLSKATTDADETRRDFKVCRLLTREAGVTAIPPSAFYGPGMGGNIPGLYARFAFCKGVDLLDEADARFDKFFQK